MHRHDPAPGRAGRVFSSVTAAIVFVSLPSFLVPSLAVLLREDLGLGDARLGWAVSTYFATSAITSLLGGPMADRRGWRLPTVAGTGIVLVALLALAGLASSWTHVVAAMAVIGFGNGLVLPASNLAIASDLPRRAQGVAFGAKQAAVPASAAVAGAAVPLAHLVDGWRVVMALSTVFLVVMAVALPPGPRSASTEATEATAGSDRGASRPARTMPLGVRAALGVAGLTGTAAAAAATTYFVVSLVASGVESTTAGWLYGVGGVAGVVGRIGWAALGGRLERRNLLLVTALLALGALGMWLLPTSTNLVATIGLTALVFGCGWGWNGVFFHGVARLDPEVVGSSTGVAQSGMFFGGMIGPSLFGAVATVASLRLAWTTAALLALTSAAIVLAVHVRQSRAAPAQSTTVQPPAQPPG